MAHLYVDADSLPKTHREIIIRRILKDKLEAVFVADRPLSDVKAAIERDTAERRAPYRGVLDKEELKKIKSGISMVVVESGINSADDELVRIAISSSIAITHDIPLASRLLEKNLLVIDDRGREFSKDNIKELLSLREINSDFREMGVCYEKSARFTQKSVNEFSNSFDRVLQKLMREIGNK